MVLTKTRLLKHDFPVHGVRSPKPPFYETALLSPSEFSVFPLRSLLGEPFLSQTPFQNPAARSCRDLRLKTA